MPLTERLHVLVSPEMQKQLDERAKAEEKSVGRLIREFAAQGLTHRPRASLHERLAIVERMRALSLPVGSVEEMKEEAMLGRERRRALESAPTVDRYDVPR